jgi:hypothetical protein
MTAGVGCKFTVHFSTSFSTTSFRVAPQGTAHEDCSEQLGICWICHFVATSTSNRVAVLRTLPDMVMSASDDGMLFR